MPTICRFFVSFVWLFNPANLPSYIFLGYFIRWIRRGVHKVSFYARLKLYALARYVCVFMLRTLAICVLCSERVRSCMFVSICVSCFERGPNCVPCLARVSTFKLGYNKYCCLSPVGLQGQDQTHISWTSASKKRRFKTGTGVHCWILPKARTISSNRSPPKT
jgi:hypothetical protein